MLPAFQLPPAFRLSSISLSIRFIFGLSIGFGLNPSAFAQENMQEKNTAVIPAVKPNTPIQKVEVSGAGGYNERRQDTASKIVVTQEDIVRYGDTNIGDVLKRLPGVTIGGVQGRGGAIRMRGLGAGYTQIMLNGEPSPPGFSLDSISPDNIERIEIIRAATAELSTQSIAGAINIVLKKAIVTAQRELKAGLSDEHGNYGVNLSLQLSDKAGRMSYAISGNLNRGDFDRPSRNDEQVLGLNGEPRMLRQISAENEGVFSSIGLSPRINWMLENGDIVTSQSFVNANRFTSRNVQVTQSILGDPALFSNETSHSVSESTSARTNLTWVHKLADSAKLDARFGLNYNKRSSENKSHALGVSQILDRAYESVSTDNGYTYGGKYTAPFVEDHAIAAGWDGAWSQRSDQNVRRDTLTGVGPITPNNIDEDLGVKVARLALFMQDEWNYSKALSIYAGLRWEGITTTSEGNTIASVKNRSSVMSPILQALYKVPSSKNDQLRFGLTRTYKAPDTSSLSSRRFVSTNNSPTSPDSMGNPNLKPELAWGIDTGFEHYLNDGGVLSVNLYLRRIDDFTRTSIVNDGRWVAMPTNDGLATTRGIEFDAKFPLRALIVDAPAVDFRANLAFNFSNVESVPGPHNRLDSQTPVSANFGVDYKLDALPLTVGANLGFQNAGPVRISLNQSSYGVPKRVLDVYALWKFDAKTNLRVALGNALHQENRSSSTYADNFGSTIRSNVTPTYLALRVNFEHKF